MAVYIFFFRGRMAVYLILQFEGGKKTLDYINSLAAATQRKGPEAAQAAWHFWAHAND
jgi:hypothetical protein